MSDDLPEDLPQGFLDHAEGRALSLLARGKQVLEVGCWKGRSTVCLARTARQVVTVDWFRGDRWTGPAFTLPEAVTNLDRHRIRDRVSILAGDARTLLPLLDLRAFDLAFYDGDHSHEETAWALSLLAGARIATIAVHDYEPGNDVYEPTVRAVHECQQATGRTLRVVRRLAILETGR